MGDRTPEGRKPNESRLSGSPEDRGFILIPQATLDISDTAEFGSTQDRGMRLSYRALWSVPG